MKKSTIDNIQLRNLRCELQRATAELQRFKYYVDELHSKIRQIDNKDRKDEIRERLIAGQTYRQIAEEMCASPNTIAKISKDLFGYRNPFWERFKVCCKKNCHL